MSMFAQAENQWLDPDYSYFVRFGEEDDEWIDEEEEDECP